jgi:hypothetical protein
MIKRLLSALVGAFSAPEAPRPVPPLPKKPGIKACCLVPENRVLEKQGFVEQASGRVLPTEVRRCKVCGCRHHRMFAGDTLEPGRFRIG